MHHEHRQPRLLAIDDSVLIHRLLKARLQHEQLEIHSASNGEQGIAMARTLQPDVILLDVGLPGQDGFVVLERLKSDSDTHDIPVIFFSGSAQTTDKVRGLDMGAIDFISKPFDIVELLARVRGAIRLRRVLKLLAQRAQVDGLTGLWNRSYFDLRLEQEVATAKRHQTALSLALCDLDRFKGINDEFGHPFGDRVLEEFARLLAAGRAGDVPCRYGGEEFGIIMPGTTAEEATVVADRLRHAIAELAWSVKSELRVTASFGVAELSKVAPPGAAVLMSASALISAADQALYAAKAAGRDRIEMARNHDAPDQPEAAARLSA